MVAPAASTNSPLIGHYCAVERVVWVMNQIGRERGWQPMDRRHFELQTEPRGALMVGSPEQVAEKILFQHEIFGHQRTLLQMSVGTMPHEGILRSIELFGTKVAPMVRDEVARRASDADRATQSETTATDRQ